MPAPSGNDYLKVCKPLGSELDDLLMADPETGEPISVTHLLPTSADDFARREVAFRSIAELSMGVMGRTPDYMNATFAGFAKTCR